MIHGDANTYRKQGCRCVPCTRANSAERARYRKRVYLAGGPMLLDPTGTARRLQALAYLGWGIDALGPRLGMHPHVVSRLRLGRRMVYRRNAASVARVYEQLCMTPGPDAKAAAHARRMGWLGPLHWDSEDIDDPAAWAHPGDDDTDIADPVAVDRLLAGRCHWRDVTQAERLEAARIALTREGGHAFCQEVLGLRSEAIRRLRQEVAA